MSRSRASRPPARAALVVLLLLASTIPVAAASPSVHIDSAASPVGVTVGQPIAYVIDITNMTTNTLNFVSLADSFAPATPAFKYLGASLPSPTCSQPPATEAVCDFGQLAGGVSPPQVTLYYLAPLVAEQSEFVFTATATVGEGTSDNGNASHTDQFAIDVPTTVFLTQNDFVQGHSFDPAGPEVYRTFTTGLGPLNGTGLSASNKHGTTAFVPTNAEVTLRDLTPQEANALSVTCTSGLSGGVSFPCFGQASFLSIGKGAVIPGGIKVTMRWDYSDLPSGMTEKKLHLIHIFTPPFLGPDNKNFEQITATCNHASAPTNMPCLVGAPVRLTDKDILATVFLNRDLTVRGW